MTLFLRTKDNRTIVDCEIWTNSTGLKNYTDLQVHVVIDTYSETLLSITDADEMIQCIKIFSFIQSLHTWLNEERFSSWSENDGTQTDEIVSEVREMFKEVADKFELIYIED